MENKIHVPNHQTDVDLQEGTSFTLIHSVSSPQLRLSASSLQEATRPSEQTEQGPAAKGFAKPCGGSVICIQGGAPVRNR